MINLSNLELHKKPYQIGVLRNILEPDHYLNLLSAFPDEKTFRHLDGGYNKFSLSEVNNRDEYKALIKGNWRWHGFYSYIKSREFIGKVLGTIGVSIEGSVSSYSSRFEFSSLPADGGLIKPHTDIPSKIVTIVLGMRSEDSWEDSWGGGTDILEPINPNLELKDYAANLSAFSKVITVPYRANQGLLFIKSKKSWHSVGPLTGPPGKMRRTLTINIERT